MLTYNPTNRISAEEALNHPWIKKKVLEPVDPKATISALNNLRTFRVSIVSTFNVLLIGGIKNVTSSNYFYSKLTCLKGGDE
jgi:serine/threonine protein kinase